MISSISYRHGKDRSRSDLSMDDGEVTISYITDEVNLLL